MSRRRVAFVTPELPTELETGGGLGNYLRRMTRALVGAGHEVELFVTSHEPPGTIDWQGARVHRVPSCVDLSWVRTGLAVGERLGGRALRPGLWMLGNSWLLARALRRREAEAPFDLVQSADYLGTGLCIPRSPQRPHLVRCSSASDLVAEANRDDSPRRRWSKRLELAALRRADVAYAPSHFVADHFARRYGLGLHVVRPPLLRECEPGAPPPDLPKRYLLHFGLLSSAKGTPLLAEALPLAWQQEPELSVVLAGRDRDHRLAGWRASWGRQRGRVVWLGELRKPELYAVLRDAEATVLPTFVDNLPNTAIESLLFGVPVIGTDGASLDELVEPGETGLLFPLGDARALAHAMVRCWRGEGPRRGFTWRSPLSEAMQPERAIDALFAVAGSAGRVAP